MWFVYLEFKHYINYDSVNYWCGKPNNTVLVCTCPTEAKQVAMLCVIVTPGGTVLLEYFLIRAVLSQTFFLSNCFIC